MNAQQNRQVKEESESDTESDEDEVVKCEYCLRNLTVVSNRKMMMKKQRDR